MVSTSRAASSTRTRWSSTFLTRGPGRVLILTRALNAGGSTAVSRKRSTSSIGGAGFMMCGAATAMSRSLSTGQSLSTCPALRPITM